MMNAADLTRAEVELALVERLSAPCPLCDDACKQRRKAELPTEGTCACDSVCGGTGRIWPLREPCKIHFRGIPWVTSSAYRVVTCAEAGCPGWVLKEMHLEDLFWCWLELDFDPWSFVSLFRPGIQGSAAEVLEAAERALLEALEPTEGVP